MVACATNKSLEIWDVRIQKNLYTFPIEPGRVIRNVAFDSSLTRVFAGYMAKETDEVGWAAWDLRDGRQLLEAGLERPGVEAEQVLASGIGHRGFDRRRVREHDAIDLEVRVVERRGRGHPVDGRGRHEHRERGPGASGSCAVIAGVVD